MDYGTDPLVSGYYSAEHKQAAESLLPNKLGMLDALKARKQWSTLSLRELKDKGITPAMMVAAGATWSPLQKKHGAQALIEFGFRWPLMKASGFKGSDLRNLRYDQICALGLTAHRIMECKVSPSDLSSLKLTPDELLELGWSNELFAKIGISMTNMIDFGFPLTTWKNQFDVHDFSSLGFTNYADCARAGWRVSDIQLALQQQMVDKKPVAAISHNVRKSGRIQFI